MEDLDCCYAVTYKSLRKFRFLPAHRLIIFHLPSYATAILEANRTVDVNHSHEHLSTSRSIRDGTEYSFFLRKLIESAEKNAGTTKNRFRYDEILQLFSTYIFLSCGRSCYETLSSNLPIPSKHTVCKFYIHSLTNSIVKVINGVIFTVANIRDTRRRVIEGELRCNQLNEYLENLKLKKIVWISEDATGIVSNIHYDNISCQLVGFVLPKCPDTGSPIPLSFGARDADDIFKLMSDQDIQRSTLVYLIMAQPMNENTQPFVLQIFGTDNRFSKEDVVKRWANTRNELSK